MARLGEKTQTETVKKYKNKIPVFPHVLSPSDDSQHAPGGPMLSYCLRRLWRSIVTSVIKANRAWLVLGFYTLLCLLKNNI